MAETDDARLGVSVAVGFRGVTPAINLDSDDRDPAGDAAPAPAAATSGVQ